MKHAFFVLASGFALASMLARDAFAAITLSGTIPAGTTPVVILQANNQPGATGVIKFKFGAPSVNAGVAYALSFCVGPAANPCGSLNSFVVNVPQGGERLAIVNASVFANSVLVVGQGTRQPVPFAVTME